MIMDEASTYVNDRFVGEDKPPFQPTWLLMAQWDKVHPHPHGSANHEGISEEYLNRVSVIKNANNGNDKATPLLYTLEIWYFIMV